MMEKKYARLAALLTAAVLCGNGAPSMADDLWVGDGTKTITITAASEITGDVYGNQNHPDANGIVTGHVKMTGGSVKGHIFGGWADDTADVKDSTVTITDGKVDGVVYGGCSNDYGGDADVTGNTVTITGGKMTWNVFGGWGQGGEVSDNTVTITSDSTVGNSVYGGHSNGGAATGNTVTITGGAVAFDVYGGHSNEGAAIGNRVAISGGIVDRNVYGGWSRGGAVTGNTVTIGGIAGGNVFGGYSDMNAATGNTVTISDGTVTGYVYGGYSNGGASTISGNTVTITGGKVTMDVYGGRSNGGAATGNTVTITGGSVDGDVYGGYSNGGGKVSCNTVTITGGEVTGLVCGGSTNGGSVSDNTLVVGGGSSTVGGLRNFETIRFQGVTWVPQGTLLTITSGKEGDLGNTKIDAGHVVILGGRTPQVGEFMTFVKSTTADTGLSAEQAAGTFTAGVAAVGTGEMSVRDDGNTLSYKITGVFRNRQTDTVAENRLAGAAFVNQGADIAADSLRLLDDGYHFGTQTFGAVYGNRSTYDVASDIKINGWSEIAGFGNIHEVKGGRLAWGVFYENGTGNYRTWNTFNNEMFRGDGSLLYNGGGAAIRLTKDSGMYYEASLRAGTLSSSMTNAVKDGNGNSYGFDSDSTYWGAHIGAGKLIQRGSGQWDIYGKYFHTDIDGDSFEMGGDRFSFDSVTSDRLRLGARYTADTDKAWSLYCGAAYEYEFSGDSRMKAGQFDAPEQSLQGSTVFGEIGTVWGRKDSPWSMDINLRGYAGEREGFSGMVQLAYAF